MCCFEFLKRIFPKSAKKLEKLEKIVRVLALLEGILGIIIIIIQLTLSALKYDKISKANFNSSSSGNNSGDDSFQNASDEERERELTKIIVLSFFGLQSIFAIILFEGARRKILLMVKIWLGFCIFKLLIPLAIILHVLFRQKKKLQPTRWMLVIQITATVFQIFQSIFVLAFHHQASMSSINDKPRKLRTVR